MRELADLMLKGGLGGAHHVVSRINAVGGVKSHGNYGSPGLHQGSRVFHHRQQRERADLQRQPISLAAGICQTTGQVIAIRECDAVHQYRQRTHLACQYLEHRRNLGVVGCVAGQDHGVLQGIGQPGNAILQAIVLVSESDAGPGLG